MNKVLFVILSLIFVSAAESDHAESAQAYSEADFDDKVGTKTHFVMFFAPWCGHCKRLAPTWEKLAVHYNEQPEDEREVTIGKVDCTVHVAVCSGQDVTGYPTLKFFKEGVDSGVKYRGQRDFDSLVKFINQQLGKEVPEEEKEKEALSEPDVPKVENGLYILSEKSFKSHIKEGDHFVKFYAPWCGHCQKLSPIWDELAKAFENDKTVTISKLDCTQAQEICQEQEVKGYPTLAYFRNGHKQETYKGARTLKELKDFVISMQEVVDTEPTADKVPTEDGEAPTPVIKIDSEDFAEKIKKGITFIKFYAPWCGHCKRLAPTWDELASKFAGVESVKIAKMDCTSNDNKNKDTCNEQEVNGFPTLNLYKNGEKVGEYSGSRKLEDLEAYVRKQMDAFKDEL